MSSKELALARCRTACASSSTNDGDRFIRDDIFPSMDQLLDQSPIWTRHIGQGVATHVLGLTAVALESKHAARSPELHQEMQTMESDVEGSTASDPMPGPWKLRWKVGMVTRSVGERRMSPTFFDDRRPL